MTIENVEGKVLSIDGMHAMEIETVNSLSKYLCVGYLLNKINYGVPVYETFKKSFDACIEVLKDENLRDEDVIHRLKSMEEILSKLFDVVVRASYDKLTRETRISIVQKMGSYPTNVVLVEIVTYSYHMQHIIDPPLYYKEHVVKMNDVVDLMNTEDEESQFNGSDVLADILFFLYPKDKWDHEYLRSQFKCTEKLTGHSVGIKLGTDGWEWFMDCKPKVTFWT